MTDETDPGAALLRTLIEMIEAAARPGATPPPVRSFPHLAHIQPRDLPVTGPHGPVPARLYRPEAPKAALVWVHGGAFVAGDLDMPESHWVSLELAARGISVLALDYRKALGGVHHPVPSDDVLAGWLAALAEPDLLGVPAARVHLGGASAGGNLTAGVALRLARGEGPRPASLVLVYPVLHPVLPPPEPSAARALEGLEPPFRFSPEFVRAINLNYVGTEAALSDPIAFPAQGDVGALPPTLILNAEADDLRPSGEAFGAQLAAAGVRVWLEHEPDTRHGYLNEPDLPEANRSIERLARHLLA